MKEYISKRVEEIFVIRSGVKYRNYVHLCRLCNKKIIVNKSREKIMTGYCLKCFNTTQRKRKPLLLNKKGEKRCKGCNRYFSIDNFYIHNKTKTPALFCIKCSIVMKHGITSIDYEKMFKKQNGVCAICNKPETMSDRYGRTASLSVDHCHITKNIRGLLCSACNTSIGKFEDDVERLRKAIKYLKKYKKKKEKSG